MCTVLLPPGVNPIPVKYIISYLGIDGKVIFKLFLEEQNKEVWYELTCDRIHKEIPTRCNSVSKFYYSIFI